MLNWLKYVRFVWRIDGLCFKKRTWIIPKLLGKPGYEGDPPRRAFFSAPIFFRYGRVGSLRFAVHEVRHKIQWHHPEIQLLTLEDVLAELHISEVDDKGERLSAREMDAEIVEQIGAPLFSLKQTSAFLELMFGRAKPSKGKWGQLYF